MANNKYEFICRMSDGSVARDTFIIPDAENGVFFIQTTHTNGADVTINKTIAEIAEAFENGMLPVVRYTPDGNIAEQFLTLKFISEDKTSAAFSAFMNGIEYQMLIEGDEEETWVVGERVIEKKYALQNIVPEAGGVFYINATYSGNALSIDKTMAEIVEAVEAGYAPFVRYVKDGAERFFDLKFITDDKTSAAFSSFQNGIEYQIIVESDEEETWVFGEQVITKEYALKGGSSGGGVTEEDKAEIVQDVLAALPTWEGGSY